MTKITDPGAERRMARPTAERLTSVESVLADGELTPPKKLELLSNWDAEHGSASPQGHGRVAGAADLGFPNPSPYSAEVQHAIVELYRLHRDSLPSPDKGSWTSGQGKQDS
ncbi:MAG: hypothetical protein V2I51_23400 [Anderseniella sp.]|jgi:hypothetical protein|nr:hypothetical protein [Anderseniella sp.]